MNRSKRAGVFFRKFYNLFLTGRRIGAKRTCRFFGGLDDQHSQNIQRIYVLNLDRQVHRWDSMQRELLRLTDCTKSPLYRMTRRFSAIDAKYGVDSPSPELVVPYYFLRDQFFVEPEPSLDGSQTNLEQRIEMTPPEIAVALSHIAIWKEIASDENEYSLILEDDVYFHREFAQTIDRVWTELNPHGDASGAFDMLYLSYEEARTKAEKRASFDHFFRPRRGLWHLSGYILSKKGAQKLLQLLPVRGPVDLWINHQFDKIDVIATSRSIISQRPDYRSDNSYSILPVLSKIGVLVHDKPGLFKAPILPKPVFAWGEPETGLTSLAIALSMLGYRCCSDISELPRYERENLFAKKGRVFDAYVNVRSLESFSAQLAQLYRNAMFIVIVKDEEERGRLIFGTVGESSKKTPPKLSKQDSRHSKFVLVDELRRYSIRLLILAEEEISKWKVLCEFLGCYPPTSRYPTLADQPQRRLSSKKAEDRRRNLPRSKKLKWDSSPWIAVSTKYWDVIPLSIDNNTCYSKGNFISLSEKFTPLDDSHWVLLSDTFPSNLARFMSGNFSLSSRNSARLIVRKEPTPFRDYTAASIGSRHSHLYGRFEAGIKAAKGPGLVTGLFLHRNTPRQEIDIEILGKDTTKMLVNVFYNPGSDGANFDYGYRGTPVLIELGFDAAKEFHRYSIDWSPTSIRWSIDGRLVHERASWNPTPIPNLPMQFYISLWPSRSKELAGKLSDDELPAQSEVRVINLLVRPFL